MMRFNSTATDSILKQLIPFIIILQIFQFYVVFGLGGGLVAQTYYRVVTPVCFRRRGK